MVGIVLTRSIAYRHRDEIVVLFSVTLIPAEAHPPTRTTRVNCLITTRSMAPPPLYARLSQLLRLRSRYPARHRHAGRDLRSGAQRPVHRQQGRRCLPERQQIRVTKHDRLANTLLCLATAPVHAPWLNTSVMYGAVAERRCQAVQPVRPRWNWLLTAYAATGSTKRPESLWISPPVRC
jgi:hypothetical protein